MIRPTAGLLASVGLLVCIAAGAIAQEAKEAKPSLKAKGRLPAYYKDVVTEQQKEAIYALQARYNDQIRKLAEEMKALTEKRDAEIEAVLSAEQKSKVDTLKADAKKKGAKEPATATTTAAAETTAEPVKEAPKEPAKTTTTTKPAAK